LTKTLEFNRAVTASEASTFLFGNSNRTSILKALCVAGARACEKFILDTREVAIVMSVGTSGSPGGD
jgi:hypothetical protein